MKRLIALCAGLICACSFPAPPTLLPPPFGPDTAKPEAARLFFPTGIVMAWRGFPDPAQFDPTAAWVVVSNSNADRLYDAGAMYSLRAANLLKYFPPGAPGGNVPFPTDAFASAVITGNYTGPMVFAGGTAYTASRDTNRLNSVALDPATGALSCRGAGGTSAGAPDCRAGSIDLNVAAHVEGPFGIAVGRIRPPGAIADVDAVMVSAQVPHIDDIQSGLVFTSSHVAALDQADPTRLFFSATVTDRENAGGVGAGPMVFDDRSHEVILSGCFARYGSVSAGGEPSTLKCGTTTPFNFLRFVPMDSGSSASARLYDLGPQVRSTDTTGLALAGVDAATGLRRLYLTTRIPDTFVRVAISPDPAFAPIVQAVSTISSTPSLIFLIQRPSGSTGPDLLAVTGVATYATSTAAGRLILFDGTLGTVVGQVDQIGDTPFAMAQFPPQTGDTSARLLVTLFGGCGISLIDVPYDRPGGATLRARIGSCPP
jgi:hypothetical protein